MCVNNLPKVATQWNSGATRDSNRGRRVLIRSAITTTPLSHTTPCVSSCITPPFRFDPVIQLYATSISFRRAVPVALAECKMCYQQRAPVIHCYIINQFKYKVKVK